MNKRGITFIGVLVSTFIVSVAILMSVQFQLFLTTNNNKLDKKITLMQVVNNTIAEVYITEDWGNLEGKTEEYELDNIIIRYYGYMHKTQYYTSKISIEFIVDNEVKHYTVERSIYYEK